MKNIKKDQLNNLVLDSYEQEVEDAIPETMEFPKIADKDKEMFSDMALKHKELKKSKRINIRINNQDLAKVKAKATRSKIPYQTLIGSLVHKYAEGDIQVHI